MRRVARFARRLVLVLLGLPLLLALLALGIGNTGPGRSALAWLAARASGGMVEIDTISGRFPDHLRAGRVTLQDADGTWLRAEDASLDWHPLRLLRAEVDVERIAAGHIDIARLPRSSGGNGGGGATVPLRVHALHIGQLTVALSPASSAVMQVDGDLRIDSTGLAAQLTLRESAGGLYRLAATRTGDDVQLRISLTEPLGGPLARLGGGAALGALDADFLLAGPLSALRTTLSLRDGPLRVSANGSIDAVGQGADLRFSAETPALTPAPDIAWSGLHLQGTLKGRFSAPDIVADLSVEAPAFGGLTADRLIVTVRGTAGRVSTDLRLDTPRAPGLPALTDAPLAVHADLQVDAPDIPVRFTLAHPLARAVGTLSAALGTGEVKLTIPSLSPLATAAGLDAQGQTEMTLRAERDGVARRLRLQGHLGLAAGPAPLPALLGSDAHLDATATLVDSVLTLTSLHLDGARARLSAQGSATAQRLDLGWTLALPDLAALAAPLRGQLTATGRIEGDPGDAALDADIDGTVTTSAGAPADQAGRLTAKLRAEHLPGAPAASLTAQGELAGAPVQLDLIAARQRDGAATLQIRRAEWRSASAQGMLNLPPGSIWPVGRLQASVIRLQDFAPLLGQPVAGSLTAEVTGGPESVEIKAEAHDPALAAIGKAHRVWLSATVRDPATSPTVTGELGVDSAALANLAGSARLALNGGLAALRATLTADLTQAAGAPGHLTATASLDVPARTIDLASLTAGWHGETARLLGPTRIALADGVRLDRLRLALRDAELSASGRLSPTLDLTAALRNIPLDLLAVFAPGAAVEGRLSAEAKLSGTLAAPAGQVTLQVANVRAHAGIVRSMPPASLSGRIRLAGGTAWLDLRADAGRMATLSVTGQAPLATAAPLDLRLTGNADLALLDPLLTPTGRRARGRVELNTSIGGSLAAPRLAGSASFADGEVQDYALGARIDHIAGRLVAEGPNLRIEDLHGRAGNGSLSLSGTVGVLAPTLPVDLTLNAKGARLLAADRLNAVLEAALTLRGPATGTLTAQGRIDIQQASIRIPERLPMTVATLNVRRPKIGGPDGSRLGARPVLPAARPAPAAPANVMLDIILAARQVTVLGRGLNAEFAGNATLHGSLANPRLDGGIRLRRGDFTLAGRTLSLTKGEVSFNGGALTDPSLDLTASSSHGTVTATITVTGTAQKPEFKLSSTPELPQDEVMARLLFDREASKLSPVELAQIAAALASLSGAPSPIASPLEGLRQGLGLDRLSVGVDASGGTNVSAGHYVAPGVYVGAKEGTGGAGATQGAVQIDLTNRLKLEGTFAPSAGTPTTGPTPQSSGSGVGITYQFEY